MFLTFEAYIVELSLLKLEQQLLENCYLNLGVKIFFCSKIIKYFIPLILKNKTKQNEMKS